MVQDNMNGAKYGEKKMSKNAPDSQMDWVVLKRDNACGKVQMSAGQIWWAPKTVEDAKWAAREQAAWKRRDWDKQCLIGEPTTATT
jgi:hypothetical protein